jgi:hypothetical protein
MRLFFLLFILSSSFIWAKDVKVFNQALIEEVRRDLEKDDDQFKDKKPMRRGRGPASVEPHWSPEHNPRLEKNRQIGPSKW